jgi:RND family efflux transporter MFP subunit
MKGLVAAGVLATLLIAGCSDSKSDAKKAAGQPATPITAAKAEVRALELTEDSVGSLEHFIDPRVGAEVAGRIVKVYGFVGKKVKRGDLLAEIDPLDLEIQNRADAAEVARLEALVANQERIVANQQRLVEKNYISQNAVDESVAQRTALAEQLKSARARLDGNRNALRKTKVVAPIDGEVEVQIVAPGDYV